MFDENIENARYDEHVSQSQPANSLLASFYTVNLILSKDDSNMMPVMVDVNAASRRFTL